MVTALGPIALSGNRLQRRMALQALAAAAPTSAADIAGAVFNTSTSAEEREFAHQINMKASLNEIDARFMRHIRVARELHHESFFREACDEFPVAFEDWSDRLDAVIDRGMKDAAANACAADRVMEGSTNFLKAVRRISSK